MSLQEGHELVAVPDPAATTTDGQARYRLGMRTENEDSVFELGSTGPNGQTFPWIYLKGEGATYEIDLHDGQLTVTTRVGDDQDVQAVVYDIDIEAMTGQKLRKGEPVRIVFSYDQLLADSTTAITDWVATTGPRYVEELQARLGKSDSCVQEMQADIAEAQEEHRYGKASRAPRSAVALHVYEQEQKVQAEVQQHDRELADNEDDLEQETPSSEVEVEDPEPVLVPDPNTGSRYVGRRWNRRRKTTLRSLRNASYRVAILVLHTGECATIVLQHPKELPAIQMTSKHGVVRQFLAESAWDVVLSPGDKLTFEVDSPMEGERSIPRGVINTSAVDEIVATGPQAKETANYARSNALAKFRGREEELRHGRPLSRNLVA